MKRLFVGLLFIFSTGVFADVTTIATFPLASYPNGTRTSSAVNVPDTATSAAVQVQRCTSATPTIWPNATTSLSITAELSLDGGTNWTTIGSWTSIGGIDSYHGVETPWSSATFSLPAGAGRKLRSTATIAGGPLLSQGQAIFSP